MLLSRSAPLRVAMLFAAMLLGSGALSGCKLLPERFQHHKKEARNTGPEIMYNRAQQDLRSQDFSAAIKSLEALLARFPFTPQARQARLDLIYAYYRAHETESALDAADTFIRENPTHPRIDYAYYIKGLVDFERTPNRIEKLFRADLNARPPQTARKAFASFRKLVEDFPKSDYAADSRLRMIYLRNRLADYDLSVARYYVRRGAWVGAAQRSRQLIEQFDGAPAVREALIIMINCYERLGQKDLADQTRRVYAANYSGEVAAVQSAVKKRWWNIF
jgi:outer membrane protein assembly factor BamD